MPNVLPHDGHVPLHRLWSFATSHGTLTMGEHAHINDCEACLTALRVCLKADTFPAALEELKKYAKDTDSAA